MYLKRFKFLLIFIFIFIFVLSNLQASLVLANCSSSLMIKENAPAKVYKLIKKSPDISNDKVEAMKLILDLIWSEPNGRLILSALSKNRVPIKILGENEKAQTVRKSQTVAYFDYGLHPINSYTNTSIVINIPVKYINIFENQNLPEGLRIECLIVFVHEFGHAFMFVNNQNNENSLEEEIGVSMLGYNLANKILTGNYLNKAQTLKYAEACLIGLLSDDHKNLPIYSDFNEQIRSYGIDIPYSSDYSDLVLMYRKLFSEGRVPKNQSFVLYKF